MIMPGKSPSHYKFHFILFYAIGILSKATGIAFILKDHKTPHNIKFCWWRVNFKMYSLCEDILRDFGPDNYSKTSTNTHTHTSVSSKDLKSLSRCICRGCHAE